MGEIVQAGTGDARVGRGGNKEMSVEESDSTLRTLLEIREEFREVLKRIEKLEAERESLDCIDCKDGWR